MTYDPVAEGAKCDACPLKGKVVVPPEIRPGTMLVIGEAPGRNEEDEKRPFVGASGKEIERTLTECGKRRHDVSFTNVLLCRPPGRTLKEYIRKLTRRNAARKRAGETPIPTPMDCCRPRLEREIEQASSLLLLGAAARNAVVADRSGESGLKKVRGFPVWHKDKPTLATYHPAFVMRSRKWTETFRSDVRKAFRHAAGKLMFEKPELLLNPTLDQLEAALERFERERLPVAVDTETSGLEQMTADLNCVGLGSERFAVVVPWRSIETPPTPMNCDSRLAAERIRNFFARYPKLCGHNIGYYDRPVLERHGMPLPPPGRVFETLIGHHVAESELPHDLDYLSSRHTDAEKHKFGHGVWETDDEYWRYNAYDCVITARLAPQIARQLKATGQVQVYESDVQFQRLCLGMHKAGVRIDPAERARHAKRLRAACEEARQRAVAAAGVDINLASPDAVRDFLYEKIGVPLPDIDTESGEPSTNKDALYQVLQHALPPSAVAFIDALLDFRTAFRSLTKDVLGFAVDVDGRVHPTWNSHSVVTGRPSCSDPNIANVPDTRLDPDSLRSMYVAAPGNVLVACDLEQIELRVVAVLSGDEIWLQALSSVGADGKKIDIHKLNASVFFSIPYSDVQPYQRLFAKNLVYMFLYGGKARMAQVQMMRVKDAKTGQRPWAGFKLDQAELMRKNLLRKHYWLERWWERTRMEFRRDRMLRSPWLGRIRRFLDGEGKDEEAMNELYNYRVQAFVGEWMGGAEAGGRLMESVGWPWDWQSAGRGLGGPGIVHHGYDAMMAEVAESRAEEAKRALESAMTGTVVIDGRQLKIDAKAKAGLRWSEMD